MAKKTTKTRATKSKATKKSIKTKKVQKIQEENSFGIMMLVIAGLALLIYFASNIDTPKMKENYNISTSDAGKTTVSGKTYESIEAAYNTLKEIPQTRRTDEEISFVEFWAGELEN